MRQAIFSPAFLRGARVGLGVTLSVIFLGAGVLKLQDIPSFAREISHFRLLPGAASEALAVVLPWLEILVGAALLIRPLRVGASFLALGLMGLFTTAVGTALARGVDVRCGCFGKALAEYAGAGASLLARDVILLAGSAALFVLVLREARQESAFPGEGGR